MRTNTLVVLIAIAILGVSSAAMAKGSGGGGGGKGLGGHVGHNHFGHNHFDRRFLRNRFFLNGWGWDWGWALYDNSGYGNSTVVAFPLVGPEARNSWIGHERSGDPGRYRKNKQKHRLALSNRAKRTV